MQQPEIIGNLLCLRVEGGQHKRIACQVRGNRFACKEVKLGAVCLIQNHGSDITGQGLSRIAVVFNVYIVSVCPKQHAVAFNDDRLLCRRFAKVGIFRDLSTQISDGI